MNQASDIPENKSLEVTTAMMRDAARFLDGFFNPGLTGAQRQTGFILLAFHFGETDGRRANYISNGAGRADIVKLLREAANRLDEATQ